MGAAEKYEERTIPAIFRNRAEEFPERVLARYRTAEGWKDISWSESKRRVDAIASWLIGSGIQADDKISIFSENRPEWAFADLAILSAGAADVTIYATNSGPEAAYIINDSDSRFCFCSGKEQLNRLLSVKDTMPNLEKIIVFDDVPSDDPIVVPLGEVMKQGTDNPLPEDIDSRIKNINPENIMTLIYTSGTTGNPKGVMLTHLNMVTQANQFLSHHPFPFDVTVLSILPLSHSLERTVGYHCILLLGQTVAYCRGPEHLLEDLTEIRPTAFLVVPRVLEKIYEGIMTNVEKAPASKKRIFRWTERVGRKAVPYIVTNRKLPFFLRKKYNIAEKLVFSKLREALGMDMLHVVGLGGAPLSTYINEFFQAIKIEVHPGYGLTETSPVTHVHTYKEVMPIKLGSVGPALPDTECTIADDGEILIKGPQVMKGYYKQPEATQEVFTEDGWFKTGDIGFIESDGYLTITDRKKDIIITAGGKNVAPQVLENKFKSNTLIEQIAVIGDRRKYLVALIAPNFDALSEWASRNSITDMDHKSLVKNPAVIAKYREIIEGFNVEFGRVEQVKQFALIEQPFTQETGELTPTLKVKRRVIEKKYSDVIETLYGDAKN